LADSGEEVSVAALASRSGVSEVTIYRRWGSAENVVLEAAVRDTARRVPLEPTGDLERDLTSWARNAERSLTTPRGRRLLDALLGVMATDDPAAAVNARRYLALRASRIQQVIDAADPPTTITVEDVLDGVLAPIYLRRIFGYKPSHGAAQLVSDLSGRCPKIDTATRRDDHRRSNRRSRRS
jgi:AcrR family transcriptional regulator